jgi:ankyrin repeat protein
MPMVAWPVINGNMEGLKLLLDNGANPNARKIEPLREYGKQRDNALVFAAGLADQRFLTLLLDRGGDPNTHNSNDEQLTYTATLHHHWPNVQLLIGRGADINQPLYTTDGYESVLSWYTRYGDFEEAYWLLQHGADPTRKMKADPGEPNYGRIGSMITASSAPTRWAYGRRTGISWAYPANSRIFRYFKVAMGE